MHVRPRLVIGAVSVALAATQVAAQSFNIDLGPVRGTPGSGFGAAANQPGVWNTLELGTTTTLLRLSGSPKAVTVTVTADNGLGWTSLCPGDLNALVNDNIYSHEKDWLVAFDGLQHGTYEVFLYGPTNSLVPTGSMTVNGAKLIGVTGDACDLSLGVSYARIVVTVDDGTLSISGAPDPASLDYCGLAALQLVKQQTPRPVRRTLKGTKGGP